MHAFKDIEGRSWEVAITVATIKRVRAHVGIDLFKLSDDGFKGLSNLLSDPVELIDVLYVIVMPQAGERGVTDEQFGEAMGGDVLLSAADAFTEGLVDFFPDRRAREALQNVMTMSRSIRDKALDMALGESQAATTGEMQDAILKRMFTESEASSE